MKEFEEFIDEFMEEYKAIGLIAAAFTNEGELQYLQDFGQCNQATQTTINADTIFGIASMTKSITALAIMKLVEEQKISLSDSVQKYIPNFEGQKDYPILIQHLLTHSTGLYPQHRTTIYEMMKELNRNVNQDTDLAYDKELAMKGTQRVVDLFNNASEYIGKPGEYLSYSNDSYGLLSTIISQVGGYDTYTEYIHHEIFRPLQMERSTIEFLQPLLDVNVQTQYEYEQNQLKEIHDFYDTAFVLMGGGAAKSTVTDLIKYVCLYLNNGYNKQSKEQFISEKSIAQMCNQHINYNNTSMYGYGLSIDNIDDTTIIGHGGALTGVSSQMLWSPEHNMGVVILCNTSDVPVSFVAEKLLAEVCNIPISQQVKKIPEYNMIADISGHYETMEDEDVIIQKKNNQLNHFLVTIAGVEKNAYAIAQHKICIPGKYRNGILEFYPKDNKIFALKLGGRILKKI